MAVIIRVTYSMAFWISSKTKVPTWNKKVPNPLARYATAFRMTERLFNMVLMTSAQAPPMVSRITGQSKFTTA